MIHGEDDDNEGNWLILGDGDDLEEDGCWSVPASEVEIVVAEAAPKKAKRKRARKPVSAAAEIEEGD